MHSRNLPNCFVNFFNIILLKPLAQTLQAQRNYIFNVFTPENLTYLNGAFLSKQIVSTDNDISAICELVYCISYNEYHF